VLDNGIPVEYDCGGDQQDLTPASLPQVASARAAETGATNAATSGNAFILREKTP
jgi:hypothetical protein